MAMNTNLERPLGQGRNGAAGAAALWLVCLMPVMPGHGSDMEAVFQQARTLFYQGRYKEAKPLLQQVVAADPRHTQSQAMLARINIEEKQGPTLADQLASVTLPRIEFDHVTVPEALDGLKALAKNATDGKFVPNFLVHNGDAMTKPITLKLENIPLSDAIKYVAQLSGTVCRYEKNVVVFSTQ